MSDKRFQCSDNALYPAQYSAVLPNTFSPSSTFSDLYSPILPQQQSQVGALETPYMLSELSSWDSLKLPEKLDLAEISCKDLSPHNYYDVPLDGQYSWANSTSTYPFGLKPNSYSSCAQVGKCYESAGTTGYCSIQKSGPDQPASPSELYKSCAYYNGSASQQPAQNLFGNYAALYNSYGEPSVDTCSYYEPGAFPSQKPQFGLAYPTSEVSNEESDIVVEDFSSEGSEEQEATTPTHCFLCSMQFRSAAGLQFYLLTEQSPLTISSQIPVKDKLQEFIPSSLHQRSRHLCNDCLGLINSIDHLQFKLNSLVKSLLKKCESQFCSRARPKRKPKYKCKRCNRVVSVKSLLDKHTRRHKLASYLCELCGRKLATGKQLKHHLKLHGRHKSTIAGFQCSSCAKVCRTKFQMKEHENYCLGLLPFHCKSAHCNKKFASATRLKNHIKLKHDKKFVAICSICNIGFVKMSDYKCHMTSHSIEKKFPCEQCDKAYKTLTNLNFHRKSHAKTLPFICPICQKGFMRREYHEAHMNNHKGVKNFRCSICEKGFVAQKNLDAHLKSHEAKASTCSTCRKVVSAGCLEDHVKLHLNSKEFECDMCKRKFNTKNYLNKHKRKKHVDNVAD